MSDGDLIWEESHGGDRRGFTGPVLENHYITGDESGNLYKVNRGDGSLAASTNVGSYGFQEGITATADERFIYAPMHSEGSEGELVKFDVENWELAWILDLPEISDTIPAVDPLDGTVYLILQDGTFYAVRSSGTVKFTTTFDDTAGTNMSKPAVSSDGRVFTGIGDTVGSILRDGSSGWEYDTGAEIEGAIAIRPGSENIFFGNRNGDVFKFSPSGTLLEQTSASSGDFNNSGDFSTDLERFCIPSSSNGMHIFDTDTLEELASSSRDGHSGSCAVDADGRAIAYNATNGNVVAFDDRDASVVWENTSTPDDKGGGGDSGISIAEGAAYVSTDDAVFAVENNPAPARGRGDAYNFPFYHPIHQNFGGVVATAGNRVIMFYEDLGLRGIPGTVGDDAVLHTRDIARSADRGSSGDESIFYTDDELGQV